MSEYVVHQTGRERSKTAGQCPGFSYTRRRLFRFRGWSVALHVLRSAADNKTWDDHRWDFWSLCIWGHCCDITRKGAIPIYPGRLLFRKAEEPHSLRGGRIVTIALCKPKHRDVMLYPNGPDGDAHKVVVR